MTKVALKSPWPAYGRMLKLALKSDAQKCLFEIRLTQYVFRKILRKTSKKRALLVSSVTSYEHNQDVLELKEEELILLQVEIRQTSDVLTLTESTEISANEHEVMRHSSRRRLRRFVQAA